MSGARNIWVVAHRWAGLTIALFLTVAGFTGAFMAFYPELHQLTAPRFTLSTPPAPDAKPIDPLILREAVEARTGGRVTYVELARAPGEAALFYVEPRPGAAPLGYDEIAVNPYTGAEQGRRSWGAISEGAHNLMPFVYQLHYKFALGDWGLWAFGIAALVWTLDCFVGFYLTLPRTRWRGWGKAWRIRTPATNGYRLNFDLHRAGGLWLWPMLLVFAWSSVGFNLREVYNPVMDAVAGKAGGYDSVPDRAVPLEAPRIGWEEARTRGQALVGEWAMRDRFRVEGFQSMYFDATKGMWSLRFRSDRDILDKGGQSEIAFDADTGRVLFATLPSGQTARATADSWLFALHMGQVGGLPYRIFVALVGLAVTMLSVTGVVIWMKKRSARLLHRHRLQPPQIMLVPAEQRCAAR